MKVTVTKEYDFHPFRTPNYVLEVGDGSFSENAGVSICDLDAQTLDLLCEQFKKDVFKKAGKEMPDKVLIRK